MTRQQEVKRWCLTEDDLTGLTPEKARDLIIRCFFESHKETLARTARKLGILPTDEKLFARVTASVRAAFKTTGGDYDHPTAEDLDEVVKLLGGKAASWGTPDDIIEFHKSQIVKVLARLPKK